jgi:hypothetical protein
MKRGKSKFAKIVESLAILGIAIPVVGLLLGGIYSVPASRLCKGREPWFSALLSLGLAITVFGIGYLSDTRILFSAGVWSLSLVLLLAARRLHGSLDGNLERFGQVHAVTLLVSFVIAQMTSHAA